MSDYIFLFDLDSTITAREILPEISRTVGKEKEMREITEKTMQGIVPFKESFLRRVELLKDIPVTEVNQMVAEIPLNEHIAEFVRENHDRCYGGYGKSGYLDQRADEAAGHEGALLLLQGVRYRKSH